MNTTSPKMHQHIFKTNCVLIFFSARNLKTLAKTAYRYLEFFGCVHPEDCSDYRRFGRATPLWRALVDSATTPTTAIGFSFAFSSTTFALRKHRKPTSTHYQCRKSAEKDICLKLEYICIFYNAMEGNRIEKC